MSDWQEYKVVLTDEQARALLLPDAYTLDYDDAKALDQAHNALADAVRANPPKPPRMPEPGWGEKVIAATPGRPTIRRVFIRVASAYPWQIEDGSGWRWDQLIDPEPVDGAT